MAWPLGKRRGITATQRFFSALVAEFGAREIARRCGVSDRAVRRWTNGEDCPRTIEPLQRLIDSIAPQSAGWMPVSGAESLYSGNTRVGGVGEYTIRAARGLPCYPVED